MRKQLFILLIACSSFLVVAAQPSVDSLRNAKKDSTLRAMIHEDSIKIVKEFAEKEKWDKLAAKAIFPVLKGSKESGVIPVSDITEIPDPALDYKIVFELTGNNPDSIANDFNYGLDEIARVINLHVAAGIPAKKIFPVIVVHAAAVNAVKNNVAYQRKYKLDNPNIKLIDDLKKAGAKFIICGQAMENFETKKEDLLPDIKISLTAQTALSYYQLKGYIWHPVW